MMCYVASAHACILYTSNLVNINVKVHEEGFMRGVYHSLHADLSLLI